MHFAFAETKTPDKLTPGDHFEFQGQVVRVVHSPELWPPELGSTVGLQLEELSKKRDRLGVSLRGEDAVHVLVPTPGLRRSRAASETGEFEWFTAAAANTGGRVIETGDEKMAATKTIDLEGHGKFSGRVIQATLIGVADGLATVSVSNAKGEAAQVKFKLEDGKIADGFKDLGWVVADKDLEALRNGKTPRAPKAAAAPRPPRPVKENPNPSGKCLCGCGGDTKVGSRFIPGHDAKAHSQIKKALRGELGEAEITSDWVKAEVVSHGGFGSQKSAEAEAKAKRVAAKEAAAAAKKAATEAKAQARAAAKQAKAEAAAATEKAKADAAVPAPATA